MLKSAKSFTGYTRWAVVDEQTSFDLSYTFMYSNNLKVTAVSPLKASLVAGSPWTSQ